MHETLPLLTLPLYKHTKQVAGRTRKPASGEHWLQPLPGGLGSISVPSWAVERTFTSLGTKGPCDSGKVTWPRCSFHPPSHEISHQMEEGMSRGLTALQMQIEAEIKSSSF